MPIMLYCPLIPACLNYVFVTPYEFTHVDNLSLVTSMGKHNKDSNETTVLKLLLQLMCSGFLLLCVYMFCHR